MNYREIEFKYDASTTELTDFIKLCESKNPTKFIRVSGEDSFYEGPNKSEFIRHRISDTDNELTFKKKLNRNNNYERVEHNISLAKNVTPHQVNALCESLGYKFNTKLFKINFVYVFDWYVACFYICYDENLKELGRYIELELDESNPELHIMDLIALEKVFVMNAIKPANRINKSLYELYKK